MYLRQMAILGHFSCRHFFFRQFLFFIARFKKMSQFAKMAIGNANPGSEHKAAGRVFIPSECLNMKPTMVDRYSCIFTLTHLKSVENNINNVKTDRKPRSFFNVGHFVSTKNMTSRHIDQWRRPVNFMIWTWILLS